MRGKKEALETRNQLSASSSVSVVPPAERTACRSVASGWHSLLPVVHFFACPRQLRRDISTMRGSPNYVRTPFCVNRCMTVAKSFLESLSRVTNRSECCVDVGAAVEEVVAEE